MLPIAVVILVTEAKMEPIVWLKDCTAVTTWSTPGWSIDSIMCMLSPFHLVRMNLPHLMRVECASRSGWLKVLEKCTRISCRQAPRTRWPRTSRGST